MREKYIGKKSNRNLSYYSENILLKKKHIFFSAAKLKYKTQLKISVR